MLYYEDCRYTIIEKDNGTYDIYDAKYGEKGTRRNQSKEWTDNFIIERKNRPNDSIIDRYWHKRK